MGAVNFRVRRVSTLLAVSFMGLKKQVNKGRTRGPPQRNALMQCGCTAPGDFVVIANSSRLYLPVYPLEVICLQINLDINMFIGRQNKARSDHCIL